MNKHFSIWDALHFGFSTLVDNILLFLSILGVGLAIMFAVCLALLSFFILLGRSIAHFLPQSTSMINVNLDKFAQLSLPQQVNIVSETLPLFFLGTFGLLMGWLIFKLIHVFFHLGMTKIALDFYDYKTATLRTLFSQGHLLIKGLFTSMLYNFIVGFGLLLFIIPGIIWAIQFGFYQQALVDENAGVLQSLRLSSQVTRGARWNLFGLYVVLALINIIGAMFMGLGLLITIPISLFALNYAYRKLHALPMTRY